MTFLLKINQIIPGICKYNLILHFIPDSNGHQLKSDPYLKKLLVTKIALNVQKCHVTSQ